MILGSVWINSSIDSYGRRKLEVKLTKYLPQVKINLCTSGIGVVIFNKV